MRNVDRKRKEVLAAQRRVGKKVSRLRRQVGITNMESADPRISRDRISRMNSIQLESHLKRLERFQSRDVQFIPDMKRRPVRREVFREYQKVESEVNRQRQANLDRIKDLQFPTGFTTIENMSKLYGVDINKPHMPTNAENMPVHRTPEQITSEKGLKRVIKRLRDEVNPQKRRRQIESWRNEALAMARDIGDNDVRNRIEKMSPATFEVLWVGMSNQFVQSLAHWYQMLKAKMAGDFYLESIIEDRESSVYGFLDWAESETLQSRLNG